MWYVKKLMEYKSSFKSVFDEWFAIKEIIAASKQSKLIIRVFENHLFKRSWRNTYF